MATSAKLRSRAELLKAMKKQHRTQANLAQIVGCSRQFVHKLVVGESDTCTAETAFAIEEALQVATGQLFVRASEPVKRAITKREAIPA